MDTIVLKLQVSHFNDWYP